MEYIAPIIWATAAFITATSALIYVWRRPGSSIRLRHKDSELEIKAPDTPVVLPSAPTQAVAVTAGPEVGGESDEGSAAALPAAAEEQESRFGRAYKLLTSGQYDRGMELIREDASEQADPTEKVRTIALGHFIAADRGDKKALEDLRRTAADHQRVFVLQFWLALALSRTGAVLEADDVFERAYSVATSDDERATVLISRARESSDPARNPEVARELLSRARPLKDPREVSRVYAHAAKLFLTANPPDRPRAFALYELAIDLAPTEKSLRFDVAHALSEVGGEAGAVLHYSKLVAQDEAHSGAWNNLGVSAAQLDLQSIAVEGYQRASALGNTLASANLAWKLINAGFLAEARSRLEPLVKDPDVHPNVLQALGGVAKTRKDDEERRDEIFANARRVAFVRIALGRSLASGANLSTEVAGSYVDGSSKLQIALESTGDVTGEIHAFLSRWDLSGEVIGDAIVFSWSTHKEKDDYLSSLVTKRGHGVLVKIDKDLHGFTYEGDRSEDPSHLESFKSWRFVRELPKGLLAVPAR